MRRDLADRATQPSLTEANRYRNRIHALKLPVAIIEADFLFVDFSPRNDRCIFLVVEEERAAVSASVRMLDYGSTCVRHQSQDDTFQRRRRQASARFTVITRAALGHNQRHLNSMQGGK